MKNKVSINKEFLYILMPTLKEVQQQVAEEEEKVSEYEKQAKGIKIPARTIAFQQEYLKDNRELAGGKIERVLKERKRIKTKALRKEVPEARRQISVYKTELQSYLSTPSGIVQYAREEGISPSVSYESTVVVNSLGQEVTGTFPVYTYRTPYGTYVDRSAVESAQQTSQLRITASSLTPIQVAAKFGGSAKQSLDIQAGILGSVSKFKSQYVGTGL